MKEETLETILGKKLIKAIKENQDISVVETLFFKYEIVYFNSKEKDKSLYNQVLGEYIKFENNFGK